MKTKQDSDRVMNAEEHFKPILRYLEQLNELEREMSIIINHRPFIEELNNRNKREQNEGNTTNAA